MTDQNGKVVTREKLFEQAWESPISQLAKAYGISDVGLAKICKRMEIPRPPRGYWSKLKVGRAPLKPRLRPVSESGQERIVITPTPAGQRHTALAEAPEIISVPESLLDPHRLTARSQAALENSKPDERGIIVLRNKSCLDIRVTRVSIDRACRIMDALLKALNARGYRVTVGEGNKAKTVVMVDGEALEIGIDEKISRTNHVLTRAEEARYGRSFRIPPRYDYFSTGILSLRLHNATYCGRQQWADGTRQKVEECLGTVIQALQQAAQQKKVQREEDERRRKAWEEEAEHQRERQRLARLEVQRAEKLNADTNAWVQATRIRRYVVELERVTNPVPNLKSWIAWARSYADTIDPLRSPQKLVFAPDPTSLFSLLDD